MISGKHGKRYNVLYLFFKFGIFTLFSKIIVMTHIFNNSTLPIPDLIQDTKEVVELSRPWKVIVLNDPVNLMSYVVMVFKKVFGFNETKATKHMMEVHQLGKSVLWIGEREQAENYAYQLQRWKLQTILEKDD